ncbi:MAG: SGNH/GDSL hydrolase family protein [Planctomycetota bacterium]|nr:SGNH/GDSL hydrolase family protein [Planctomycetota bacterium]
MVDDKTGASENGESEKSAESETENSKPRISGGKKLGFTLILLLMLIPVLELLGRLAGFPTGALQSFAKIRINDSETFDRVPGIFRPGYSGRVLWPKELAFDLKINQLGMRGPEVAVERTKGVYRILCVGDSNTFGLYSGEDATWPEVLRQQFKKDGLEVEVLNSGCPGWSTADVARYLKEKALDKVKPDMVLHMFCGNDPYDIVDVEATDGKYARLAKRVKKYNALTGMKEALRYGTALGEFEARIRMVFKAAGEEARIGAGQGPGAKPLPLPIPDQDYKKHEDCYGKIAALCKERKIALATVCFPHHKSDLIEQKGMATLERRMGDTAVKNGAVLLPLVTAFRALPEQDSLYNLPYDYHANEKGNKELGRLIGEALKTRKLGPYSE